MDGRERRLFPRVPLNEEFFCYAVDGARLDAHSLDISAGGIFLRTEDDLPRGTPIALVFKKDPRRTHPIYLTGRVVRRTTAPVSVVGVRWVKAVSHGPQEELVNFLEEVVKLEAPQVRAEIVPGQERPRLEFTFPRIAAFGETDVETLHDIEEERTADLSEDLRREREEKQSAGLAVSDGVRMRIEPPPLDAPGPRFTRTEEPGALTRQVEAGELRLPASIPAELDIDGKRIKATVTHIGTAGLFLQTKLPPQTLSRRADVTFQLRVRGGMATLKARCKVLATDDGRTSRTPGYDLQIARLDEDGHDGILRQYVRWLTFRSMAQS